MKPALPAPWRSFGRLVSILAAVAPLAVAASEAPAGPLPTEPLPANSKLYHAWAGGVDPHPYLKSVKEDSASDNLLLQWTGLSGPYVVQGASNVAGPWTAVGDPTSGQSASVTPSADLQIFRIQGATPAYLSESTCRGCHPASHNGVAKTAHAGALQTLKAIGQHKNPGCLPCHTVGFGVPGGFVSDTATPLLGGVQCENCHGPGGAHVADPGDKSVRPVVAAASMTCGGCHTDAHHPTYDEWLTSAHRAVNPEFQATFMSTNIVAAESRMRSCGACHSGAVRLAMLEAWEENVPEAKMPSGDDAYKTHVTCSVCHTAHEATENGSQLRNPTHSTAFFSYYTATNTSFTLQYKPEVQICAQCHNQRGAVWDGTGRPPHHSPQYNILTGNIDADKDMGLNLAALPNSSHRDIPHQCTHCHTHGHEVANPSEENPNYTGHSFHPLDSNCMPCHTEEEAEVFVGFRQRTTKSEIAAVKTLLDTWGATKSPEALRAKYGKTTWEYASPGQLSPRPPGTTGAYSPTAAEQSQIVAEIKKARHLLYMVEHDGSYGVHNARYSSGLLGEAKKLVQARLNQ